MTKDPERIDKITKLIKDIWKLNPELRFFQLLEMLSPKELGNKTSPYNPSNNFYKEDSELEASLSKHYQSSKESKKTTKHSFIEL